MWPELWYIAVPPFWDPGQLVQFPLRYPFFLGLIGYDIPKVDDTAQELTLEGHEAPVLCVACHGQRVPFPPRGDDILVPSKLLQLKVSKIWASPQNADFHGKT